MKTGLLSLDRRIEAFAALGNAMRDGAAGSATGYAGLFSSLAESACNHNPWFTPDNVRLALSATGNRLTYDNLHNWLSHYPEISDHRSPVTVGVVMAGNIPLAGFHDLLCVLITGNKLLAKFSTKDELLMKAVADVLVKLEPAFADKIETTAGKLEGFDMIIATGSNNTSRYFDYYFRKIPSIIRRNRKSMAIIDGTETDTELTLMGDDIFSYFGLGCRNVAKIFLPAGYEAESLPGYWQKYRSLREHYKYSVNYDHQKAVMMISHEEFIDAGFVLLRQSGSLAPPMAVINYEFYSSSDLPAREVDRLKNELQCVTGHGYLPFGNAQHPELWDYADNIDTILFVLKKNPRELS